MKQQRPDTVYHKQTLFVLSSSSSLACSSPSPGAVIQDDYTGAGCILRSLLGRCGGGSRIRWGDPSPAIWTRVPRGSLPTPSCMWGSSLTPLGRMSNTDCLLALLWLLTAGGAGAAVVYIAVAACRPAESQECFPPMGQHHNSAE